MMENNYPRSIHTINFVDDYSFQIKNTILKKKFENAQTEINPAHISDQKTTKLARTHKQISNLSSHGPCTTPRSVLHHAAAYTAQYGGHVHVIRCTRAAPTGVGRCEFAHSLSDRRTVERFER